MATSSKEVGPVFYSLNSLSIEWVGVSFKRSKKFAAKNYSEADFFLIKVCAEIQICKDNHAMYAVLYHRRLTSV